MKHLYVVGGANGSGKTTFARRYCEAKRIDFLNADDIAAGYSHDIVNKDLNAARDFFGRLDKLFRDGRSFALESTLSGKTLASRIKHAKDVGYDVILFYLFVDNPEISIERIRGRVLAGGHYIPDNLVRQRTFRSISNFFGIYKNLADAWFMYYNGGIDPVKVAEKMTDETVVYDHERYRKISGLVNEK